MPLDNNRGLVSPRLLADLSAVGFFPAQATMLEWNGTKDSVGSPDLSPSNLDPIAGLIDLACRLTPVLPTGEIRQEGHTEVTATDELLFDDRYPTITDEMFAEVGGTIYNVIATVLDGQSIFTKLRLEIVTT